MTNQKLKVIGQRIRSARLRADLKQAALAQQIGVSRTSLTAWERGWHAPAVANLYRLASAVGVSLEYLLGSEGDTGASITERGTAERVETYRGIPGAGALTFDTRTPLLGEIRCPHCGKEFKIRGEKE